MEFETPVCPICGFEMTAFRDAPDEGGGWGAGWLCECTEELRDAWMKSDED
jgi:hypothetical protein